MIFLVKSPMYYSIEFVGEIDQYFPISLQCGERSAAKAANRFVINKIY